MDCELANKVFKTENCRKKYAKYAQIVEIFTELIPVKKKSKATSNSDNDETESAELVQVERYKFKCLSCHKINQDSLGKLSNLRRHLNKVSFSEFQNYRCPIKLFSDSWNRFGRD
jgi:hypothetical protein